MSITIDQDADFGLRTKLGVSARQIQPTLNPAFRGWEEHIAQALKERNNPDKTYREPEHQELYRQCARHARKHKKPLTAQNTIIFVHPFYLSLSETRFITKEADKTDAYNYTNNLFKLLARLEEERSTNTVLLETIHHYAAASSLLTEQGMIDQTIFTEYDTGKPLRPVRLQDIPNGTIYFVGGYNKRCLSTAITQTQKQQKRKTGIYAIPEIAINSTEDEPTRLKAETIENREGETIPTINLEELLQKI